MWGVYCLFKTPVDAIPDLSENQIIIFTDWPGRSPQEIDDQITYPLSVNLQGLAGVKAIRASSEFNFSMINVIFEDDIDFYFARTRVLERLNNAATFLPDGVVPYMAPDATALGQIFWYTVEGDGYSADELRAIQDWYVRYQLYVPGVAEVSSVGGFVREYHVNVDPQKLRAFGISIGDVFDAVSRSNAAAGGKVFFEAGAEFLIRGIGWLKGVRDLESAVVAQRGGVPIFVRNVASVQLGPAFRRSMLEKDDREAVGGVVLMRYGENPLKVTDAVKQRIEQLQPGLPPGVRIVPFYERTRLIHDAIGTLTSTLIEELVVASLAILLILRHVRSAFIVCATLPLAVLIAFIFMYYLGIPSNIMSLSGIAISIGLFVDAAVVMVENTTHELTRQHGANRISGDITETAIRACKLVGKPIFFAVMIMLISFIPVFALGGIEGKMFRPLAFTKTFAMIGVSIVAITFVPAVIPLLVKGRLQREEDNWLVRSFIEIYKPVLTWLMNVPAAGIAFMAFLFIIGTGLIGNRTLFLATLAVSLFFGSVLFRRLSRQMIAFVLLAATGAWAWHLPKLGREFMPPLDEGSVLDMPLTVPRVSITQAAGDIRVRDAVMRGFPEIDQVVGKVGRAETATDPSGIDMVETVVTLRPKEWWPRRKIRFDDATDHGRRILEKLQSVGAIDKSISEEQRESILNAAAMTAVEKLDRELRDLAHRRQSAYERPLATKLVVATIRDLLADARAKNRLAHEPTPAQIEEWASEWAEKHGLHLVQQPRREEMTHLARAIIARLSDKGALYDGPALLLPEDTLWHGARDAVRTTLGQERASVVGDLFDRFEMRRDEEWQAFTKTLNWELEDRAYSALAQLLVEDLREQAAANKAGRDIAPSALKSLVDEQSAKMAGDTFLWRISKADLVKELDSELQMPGWGNIWTQPIINRVDMLATGVRTMIGVKVFGPRLEDRAPNAEKPNGQSGETEDRRGIQSVANEIAGVLKGIRGAVDVFPDQVIGRSYLQIEIDRERAARYGVNVAEVQEAIEVAMGGKTVTNTVEGRRRFPVRVRYAGDFWQTQPALRRTLVTGRRDAGSPDSTRPAAATNSGGPGSVDSAAEDSAPGGQTIQIPISEVADIVVVEGPSVIKSENGMLRAYVQLNVRDRDVVGFVEEAQQAVAARVKLPPGFFIEWSGQFEHQVRARQTLQIIFPVVILLMFVILYMTFNDVSDALLIMLAVPGALIGGVIFQSLFGFNFSVAVWVGFIACFGEATQTGIVMLVYLHEAISTRGGLAKIGSPAELKEAIIAGAVHRLRPKLMTEGVAIIGLVPMLWATGTGAEVMRPMAAPVLGGMLVADEVIDLLLPVIFHWYQLRRWRRIHQRADASLVSGITNVVPLPVPVPPITQA
jgi:Cu(I)/Ag(I) efflux system membrane protein CusA/SilA